MAAAAPSPLASSVEKTNGAKLSRLLIDGGTTVLRNLFDHYHHPDNLEADLNHHYGALNDLLEAGHLHRAQWEKLFPTNKAGSKVKPDSNNFDITLLFLLLTNICGLSSPRGGWHRKPHPRDTSRAANLARIKFFRNELYGHVTTTGVDTPTFCALWQEIGAALCGLGLHQADINRLKAERCGEEDYIDALLEWADSEEDIKSQLKVIRQSLTKVQQTVDDVRKTQLEDHEILQESKVKLEEVHQVQTKTQQTVNEVRKTQLEDSELLQDSKVKLDGVNQVQARTQQVVGDVRQTQLEDRWKLEEVLQIEKTTHDVVTESRQSQLEDSKTIQDMKSKVKEVSELVKSLTLTFEQKVEVLEGKRENNRQDEILKKLAKIDTMKDVRRHTDSYVDGTRLSIFAKVESWLKDKSSPNRVMVICGNAGMGKSVIAAVTCQKTLEARRLAGSHFCQHDRARHRNPNVLLQSLASHFADSLPDYKKALVERMSRNLGVEINDMELKDLFELLFEEPLSSLNDPGLTYLMVIDGIDESEYQGRNDLLDVIADYFKKLPLWIRFLVTTRPEVNIADRLKCLQPFLLEPNNEENLKDIRICVKEHLRSVLQSESQESILQALVQKSEGVMLYAHYLVYFIKENVPLLTTEQLDSILPSGISSVYQSYFKRLETELRKELKVTEEKFMNFLSAVAAAREPLPLGFLYKLMLSGTSPSVVQRKVNAAIVCVSALLPVQDGRIHFFHKSVKDWLIDASNYGQHHFSVNEKEGHYVLSELCIDELDDVKRKGVDGARCNETTKYALQHGFQHMLQPEEDSRGCNLEDVVKKYCLDFELVYAKLCVGVTPSEDILYVLKQERAKVLMDECQRALGALLYLLRKHLSTLKERPCAIFQSLLNEGGPELSSRALTLLETTHSDIPYMEFVHKKDPKGLLQTKFQCSAAVVCFDVSPQLDYMVCECKNGTIQLWSLHTGKQLWICHVTVKKDSVLRKFEPTGVISIYRSVVFHPLVDLVLPGILSHAYNFHGDLEPLFPSSKCRFSVCSVSADKTKMLTDCPDNEKSIIMWSLKDGSQMTHFAWNEEILSFAWSPDGRLLAISARFGSISLVDVVDGFKTLAHVTTSIECGGMMKFTPDCQFLFCFCFDHLTDRLESSKSYCLYVKMETGCNFSLDFFPDKDHYYPWEFESCSETGFLLGDPFYFPFERNLSQNLIFPELVFVLNEQSVLTVVCGGTVIEMLHPDVLTRHKDGCSKIAVREVVFSLDDDTLYVVTPTSLMAWDISSEKSKAEISVSLNYFYPTDSFLVVVRVGILLITSTDTLELWNVELSECMRCWSGIQRVVPISEERVACEVRDSNEVIILDTTSGDIVSTITIQGKLVACNSKSQMITARSEEDELQMQCGKDVLWKISPPFNVDLLPYLQCNTFSPTGQCCVVGGEPKSDHRGYTGLYVLDAVSGRTLHMLCTHVQSIVSYPDCKFVSDEECVISIKDKSKGYCLRLFNVKSGDLLSEIVLENKVCSLAACPRKRLIAIALQDSNDGFKFLKVKLPQDKGSKTSKRSFSSGN